MQIRDALYTSSQPQLRYTVHPLASGSKEVLLIVDGQAVSATSAPLRLTWPAQGQAVTASVKSGDLTVPTQTFNGIWAMARFLSEATWSSNGSLWIAERPLREQSSGQLITTVRLEFDFQGAPPMFRHETFAGLACQAKVTQ